jgi:hypothetical protein
MRKTAEWWTNECGGVFCSHCGAYFDDYYVDAPKRCDKCGSIMSYDSDMVVYKDYRLSRIFDDDYMDESEYPDWLLRLRQKYLNQYSR